MFEILDDVELPTAVAYIINLEQFYNQAVDNKYKYHYQRLVERAKSRWLSGYRERHHIIPKCLGGTNDSDNMVCLTAEEHYVAHQLLIKMFPGVGKLIYAANMMSIDGPCERSNNKRYGWLRKLLSEEVKRNPLPRPSDEHIEFLKNCRKGKKFGPLSEAHKARLSEVRKGRILSEETRAKMSESLKTRVRSDETKRKISESLKGNKLSEETKQKLSKAMKNRVFSDETKRKMSEAQKGKALGRKVSAETKAKMSASRMGNKNATKNKKPFAEYVEVAYVL